MTSETCSMDTVQHQDHENHFQHEICSNDPYVFDRSADLCGNREESNFQNQTSFKAPGTANDMSETAKEEYPQMSDVCKATSHQPNSRVRPQVPVADRSHIAATSTGTTVGEGEVNINLVEDLLDVKAETIRAINTLVEESILVSSDLSNLALQKNLNRANSKTTTIERREAADNDSKALSSPLPIQKIKFSETEEATHCREILIGDSAKDTDCIHKPQGSGLQDGRTNELEIGCQRYSDSTGICTPRTLSGLASRNGLNYVPGETNPVVSLSTSKPNHETVSDQWHSTTQVENLVPFPRDLEHRPPLVTPRQIMEDATSGKAYSSVMATPQASVTNTPARTSMTARTPISTDCSFASFFDAFKRGIFTRTTEECLSAGISQWVLAVSSGNAQDIRFSAQTGCPISFHCPSGAIDETDRDRSQFIGTPSDYMRALRELYLEEDLCIKENWINNHLRWIVWKLASLERRFASFLAGHVLTYDNVLRQLAIRYEREIGQGLRSSVRKIVNRDVSSTSLMILCVAGIQQTESQTGKVKYGLELTDGWYSVRSEIDEALSGFIDQKRIRVGTKLVLSNAKLLGLQEGADHLDDGFDVFNADRSPHLKIRANGCRIARWNAKLGFVSICRYAESDSGLLVTKRLHDVCLKGGSIPQIDVVVVASDPVKYLERSNDGRTSRVWSEAEESNRMEEMEKSRQKLVEQFRDEIAKGCEDEVDENSPELWTAMQSSVDPSEFFHALNDVAQREILEWKEKRSHSLQRLMQDEMEAKLEEIECDTTKSTPFIRCIVRSPELDAMADDPVLEDEAVLTIWQPSEDQMAMLKNGAFVRLQHVDVQPHLYNGRKQLQARKETAIFVLQNQTPGDTTKKVSRIVNTNFLDVHALVRSVENSTAFGTREPLNLIGYVVAISLNNQSLKSTTLCITDESNLLLKIVFNNARGMLNQALRSILDLHLVATSRNTFAVVGFEHLRVLRFDTEDLCAVLECNELSVVQAAPKGSRANRLRLLLRRSSNVQFLRLLAAWASVGVPGSVPTDSRRKFVGYIFNFHLLGHQLFLHIDVGSCATKTAAVPIEVLVHMQGEATVESQVAFIEDDGCVAAQLHCLHWLYRCRHVLFKFIVDHSHSLGSDVVLSMQPVDAGALAELYASSHRRKGLHEEQKSWDESC